MEAKRSLLPIVKKYGTQIIVPGAPRVLLGFSRAFLLLKS